MILRAMAKSKKAKTNLELCAARLHSIWELKRKPLQLTQKKAAEAIGISQGAFNQYIKGTIPLNVEFAVAIADLLRVEVSDINPEWDRHNRSNQSNRSKPPKHLPSKQYAAG